MTESATRPRQLTPKGRAARQKIIEAAAGLIYERGVAGTNNELVRKAAGISGSQLSHYFPDKESLVRAVLAWRADSMIGLHRDPPLGELDSIEALRAWAASYTGNDDVCMGGCSFGSLAAEVMKSDLAVGDEIAAGFGRWRDLFQRGLTVMRERGELRRGADPAQLAYVLMAAFQGGMMLAQAAQEVAPLRAALDAAIDHVASFSARPRPGLTK
ncbi:MAG: TetR/AcrR family transcriptional regulator [Streptosporangiales bacterium]|jgi:AcrR family transcriptional regulator|nr:TetR/AcrR family transcriptional regulator [Streptosporangiales bacterium]